MTILSTETETQSKVCLSSAWQKWFASQDVTAFPPSHPPQHRQHEIPVLACAGSYPEGGH